MVSRIGKRQIKNIKLLVKYNKAIQKREKLRKELQEQIIKCDQLALECRKATESLVYLTARQHARVEMKETEKEHEAAIKLGKKKKPPKWLKEKEESKELG